MDQQHLLFRELHALVEARTGVDDPSHDISHIDRVTNVAYLIAVKEHADTEIVLPSALFHDIVTYPKNDPRSQSASDESATVAEEVLTDFAEKGVYPHAKIPMVATCIRECSFSKRITPRTIEGKVVQDADLLEATGMIAIMRTFASCGQMRRAFYDQADPFCERRAPAPQHAGVDLFYTRLLQVPDRLHTQTALRIASRRHAFLCMAIHELRLELGEAGVL